MTNFEAPKVTVLGGGTGSSTLLRELKHEPVELSAVVNMSDDGGSSGKLRDQYDVLPPGDVRQCISALSTRPWLSHVFEDRIPDGELAGHAVGNIFLTKLAIHYRDFGRAVEVASKMLGTKGRVLPVTTDRNDLVMEDGDQLIRGEYEISHRRFNNPDPPVRLDPQASVTPEAETALRGSDLIVIAPGKLHGSLLPVFAVNGMRETLQETKAKIVMIFNLLNMPGQTDGWHVVDYIHALEAYTGNRTPDYGIYNFQLPSQDLIDRFGNKGENPVGIEPNRFSETTAKLIGSKILAETVAIEPSNDILVTNPRTRIRHNAKVLAKLISGLAAKPTFTHPTA